MMDYKITESDVQLHFDNVKNYIIKLLETNTWDIDTVGDTFNNSNELIKTAIEHGFRYYILTNFKKLSINDFKHLLDLSVSAAERKLCSPPTPIFLMNDILNNLTVEDCSDLFSYLEDSAQLWRSDLFYSSVKNYLLRMCNDLLKRLSKSQSTVFSGRIHVFLAKLFPLNEKSGLNLMSHFSENMTRFTTSAELFEETINKSKNNDSLTMEFDDVDRTDELKSQQQSVPIDYNLYKKFWSLQDAFSRPFSLYEKSTWKQFVINTNEVLDALKSYKLDDLNSSIKKNDTKKISGANVYFAKYLTSPKLLDLQLNDSNFRRQILVQFIILFQYVNAEVKFKSNTQVLNDEQNTWIKTSCTKVYQLLKEIPPNGEAFANHVKHILDREEIWNKWKNEGCPSFVKEKRPAPASTVVPEKKAKVPKILTSDFHQDATKVFKFSNPEMAKLCNINHDNLNACTDTSRQFLPTIRDFFEEPIEQLDPANEVEKQYHLVNKTDWSWKALRLLAKRSAFYFMQNQNVRSIPEFLEAICNKLSKEFQVNQGEQAGSTESESTPLNDDESVQLNDEMTHNNPSNNAQTFSTSNIAIPSKFENIENAKVEPKDHHSQMTPEERLTKLKQEFAMDEYQEDSQSSTNSNTPPRLLNNREKMIDDDSTKDDKKVTDLVDEGFMDYLSNNMKSVSDWKKLALELQMDGDTIDFIESDESDVKKQCKRILQLWKEREEKKAFKSIVISVLKSCHADLGADLDAKFH